MPTFSAPSRTLLSTISRALKSDSSTAARSFSSRCIRNQSASTPSLTTTCTSRKATSRTQRKLFSTSPSHAYKTVEEAKSRYRSGVCSSSATKPGESANIFLQPFSWAAGLTFLAVGGGLVFYFQYEKDRMERKRIADATKGVGRPKVGGPFQLVDQNGKPFTEQNMKGKYALVRYAGFMVQDSSCRKLNR